MTGTAMARRRFTPTPGASLATAIAIAILIGLGVWQLHRLDWKEALIAERDSRLDAAPLVLPDSFAEPDELEYRRVRLTGTYRHDGEMLVSSRTHRKQVGQHVFTPMTLDDGRVVLVNRGWVPMDRLDPADRAAGQIAGPIALDAILRVGGWRGSKTFRPANRPQDGLWLWIDLPAMAGRGGLDNMITDVYAQALPRALPGGLPIGVEPRVAVRNDHLQYALTWFSLAFALLVIYIVFSMKRETPDDRSGRAPRERR